jgi:F0F1-type ATP synthase membrane subunit b/b'
VRFEDIVSELQQKRESAAQAYAETLRIKAETEKLKAELKKQSAEFKSKRDKIVEDARREAREIIENAKDETTELMKQFRKLSMETASKDQLKQMEEIKAQIHQKGSVADKAMQKERRKSSTSIKDIKLGMTVDIISIDDRGTVVSLPNNNGDFQAQIGIMKVKTNVSDVRIVEETAHIKSGDKVISERRTVGSKTMNIKTELDLRGFLAYDAIMEVDKFIDDAIKAKRDIDRIKHKLAKKQIGEDVIDLWNVPNYITEEVIQEGVKEKISMILKNVLGQGRSEYNKYPIWFDDGSKFTDYLLDKSQEIINKQSRYNALNFKNTHKSCGTDFIVAEIQNYKKSEKYDKILKEKLTTYNCAYLINTGDGVYSFILLFDEKDLNKIYFAVADTEKAEYVLINIPKPDKEMYTKKEYIGRGGR